LGRVSDPWSRFWPPATPLQPKNRSKPVLVEPIDCDSRTNEQPGCGPRPALAYSEGHLRMVTIRRLAFQPARHHWTDWAGFLCCVGSACTVLWRTPILGIMLLPLYVSDVVAGIAFLVRGPARARLEGWGPRIATYGGTFLIPAFFALGGWRYPSWLAFTSVPWVAKAGYCLWLWGLLLNIWSVWQLRRSFSLAPQARKLVRTGPYRLARHPIYAAHLLKYLGIWLAHFTLPVAFTLLVWLALIAMRVHYEEMVLEDTFADYTEYRRQAGLFCPRLLSADRARAKPAQLTPDPVRISSALSPTDWRNR
jgi:protein-S-isoprenylcysteine O-methyltransferase Ste14